MTPRPASWMPATGRCPHLGPSPQMRYRGSTSQSSHDWTARLVKIKSRSSFATTAATVISFSKPRTRRGRPTTPGAAPTGMAATARAAIPRRGGPTRSATTVRSPRGVAAPSPPGEPTSPDLRTTSSASSFPAIQWLEKNGYDVSYMTGVGFRSPRKSHQKS